MTQATFTDFARPWKRMPLVVGYFAAAWLIGAVTLTALHASFPPSDKIAPVVPAKQVIPSPKSDLIPLPGLVASLNKLQGLGLYPTAAAEKKLAGTDLFDSDSKRIGVLRKLEITNDGKIAAVSVERKHASIGGPTGVVFTQSAADLRDAYVKASDLPKDLGAYYRKSSGQ